MSNTSNTSSPLDKALEKLAEESHIIQRRMGVRAVQQKRIEEAFKLLTDGKAPAKHQVYLEFLRRVRTVVGDDGVTLCAAGLGPAAVVNMKDRTRVDLPFLLKQRAGILNNEHLHNLSLAYKGNHPDSASAGLDVEILDISPQPPDKQASHAESSDYTGDVYELNIEDIMTVAISDEVVGKILLTDTYKVDATSFLTIPISQELTIKLIRQRPRIM